MKTIRERLEAWGDSGILHPSSAPTSDMSAFIAEIMKLPKNQRNLLLHCFIYSSSPTHICTCIGIPKFPATHFIDAFTAAEKAIETALKEIEK